MVYITISLRLDLESLIKEELESSDVFAGWYWFFYLLFDKR